MSSLPGAEKNSFPGEIRSGLRSVPEQRMGLMPKTTGEVSERVLLAELFAFVLYWEHLADQWEVVRGLFHWTGGADVCVLL